MTNHSRASTLEVAEAVVAPLARIHLAASELVRRSATLRDRALAESVVRDVLKLDRVTSTLSLHNESQSAVDIAEVDLRPVLSALHERFAPALRPRGLEWLATDSSQEPVLGDPYAVRRAAVALIRAIAEAGIPEASLGLAPIGAGTQVGLVLEVEPNDAASCLDAVSLALEIVDRSAWVANIEIESIGAAVRAIVWLRTGTPK